MDQYSSLFPLFLVVLLCSSGLNWHANARPSTKKITSQIINQICSKHTNTSFCLNVLNSDPRVTAAANFKELVIITMNYVKTNLTATQNLIKSLDARATDPRLKERYGYCVEFYDDGLGTLESAFYYLKTGDLQGVSVQNSGVYVCINDCDEELVGPPPEPSQLSSKNLYMKNLIEISVFISDML